MKVAVVIVSDPKAGEEALGRAFNGLALAADAQAHGDEVAIVFAGAGTRWPAELTRLGHPGHGLYAAVRPLVVGASCGCAAVFGATEGVMAAEVPVLADHALAGTPGVASLRRFLADGFHTMVF